MTLCPPVHLKDLCWDCVTPSAARREQNQTLPLGWLTSAYAAAPPQVKGWTTGKKEQKRAGTWRREIFDDNWSNINSQSRFTDTPESSCEKNKNIFAGVGDQCQSELMSSFLKKKKEKPKKKKTYDTPAGRGERLVWLSLSAGLPPAGQSAASQTLHLKQTLV